MKKFIINKSVFEKLPNYCVGIIEVSGIDNSKLNQRIDAMLSENIAKFSETYKDCNIREIENIKAYREAFLSLNMNPNKFMCSIEALTKRVQKVQELPHINPIVNLGNALSVKYLLAMGAHDIEKLESDLEVRFSTTDDSFLPMGDTTTEVMPKGELIYASNNTVKTRRWIWRQSDNSKITAETNHVFFPIDGFTDINKEQVIAARDELAEILEQEFACQVRKGFVDINNNEF